jgi:prepilin-type N-terminal cleavage/methylation domain-containing protein
MRRQRGFSLIELLFALLVLTIVITTTLAMFAERAHRLQMASETILAYQVLSNEAEVRRRLDFNNLGFGGNSFLSDTTLLESLGPFDTEVKVEDDNPGVRKVLLRIRWKNGKRVASLGLLRVDTGGTNLW